MAKLFALVVIFITAIAVLSPSKDERVAQQKKEVEEVANATAENISPKGELATMFSFGSKFTDVQRENMEKSLKGKIVQWQLPIYEVKKRGDGYKIQTANRNETVGTFIQLRPRNEKDTSFIESLKEGDLITVKGKITGVSMRHIDIADGILIAQ